MHTPTLLSALSFHQAHDADERIHRERIVAFVERNSQRWWQRSTLDGHITASAWVLNSTRTHALLLHHAKLNCWVQPGGHLDDEDASPAAGALREAHEETGLAALQLADENLFDVDVHSIPARVNEPAHLHYDLRYLMISPDSTVTISDESLGARWIALDELARAPFERSISRMAEKSLQLPFQ
ncbi:MAG: NUDIX hydrolase [Betaproteobacteria bacterium]|nr:NUDIX hydrolase [Betaproteobacteria bacterium]